jgi:hypothetical protein
MNNSYVSMPAIITPENYPSLFVLDNELTATPLQYLLNDQHALDRQEEEYTRQLTVERNNREHDKKYGDIYQYPYLLGNTLQNTVVYEPYRINGMDVMISGDRPSVHAMLLLADKYRPVPYYKTDVKRYTDIDSCHDNTDTTKIGSYPLPNSNPSDNNFVVIFPDRSEFSGSGTIICLTIQSADSMRNGGVDKSKIFIPLFRDSTTLDYSNLGGKINLEKHDRNNLDFNILYVNANKESIEESANLFIIKEDGDKNDSKRTSIDIESRQAGGGKKTKYRTYPHFVSIKVDGLNEIKTKYDKNVSGILVSPTHSNAYRETNGITFIRFDQLIARIEDVKKEKGGNIANKYISKYNFIDYKGNLQTVSGRTIQTFANFIDISDGILTADNLKSTTSSKVGESHHIEF